MESGYEVVLADVLARLQTSASDWPEDVRRAHRTAVPREVGDAIQLLDGRDEPNGQKCHREADFVVRILKRSDDGVVAADETKIEVMRRLSPYTQAYADGISITPGRIEHDVEIADSDAVAIDMHFDIGYPAGEWSLGGTS